FLGDETFERRRPRARRAERGRMRRFADRTDALDDTFDATRQIVGAWRDRFESLRPYTDAAIRQVRSQARLKIIGLTRGEYDIANQAVERTSREVRSVSTTDLIEQYTNLFQALGDAGQAARALPAAARYTTSFRAFFGDQFDPESANRQVLSSYKALEYMGATQRGEGEMDKLLQEFIRIQASTSGRVTPDEILVMLRRSKVAGRSLSAEGLRNVSTLIEDFSAPTAGQSLMSAAQTIVGGVMKNSAMNEFMRLGLVDRSKVEYSKAGLPKKLLPEAIKGTDVFQRDPYEWVSKVLSPALQKSGINVEDDNAVRRQLFTMFGNRNAFAFIDTLLTQRLQVEKEARRMNVSADAYEQTRQLDIDPELRSLRPIEEVQAQWQDFQVAVGKNLLPAGTELVKVVTPLAQLVAQHPKLAAWTAGVIVGGKALGGLVETAMLLGRAGVGVYGFFERTRAGAAAAGMSLDGMSGKAKRLRGTLGGLSGTFRMTLFLATVGFTIEQLVELFSLVKQYREQEKRLAAQGTQAVKSYDRMRQSILRPDNAAPQEQKQRELRDAARAQATTAMQVLDRPYETFFSKGRELRDALLGRYSSRTEALIGMTPTPYGGLRTFRPEAAVPTIRQRAPELARPEVMTEFRKLVASWKLPDAAQSRINTGLQLAYPQAFQQSSMMLAQEFQNLQSSMSPLGQALAEMYGPANMLPPSLRSGADAANAFARAAQSNANRLQSITWTPPTLTLPSFNPQPGGPQQQMTRPGTSFGFTPPFT
ncbi:MAG TPA: hypothetical protein VGV38_09670, partial [Pyrinomonadaceae bacterium]|nr:hypothetical protein [Pyrinomonadaceae bacterium]